MIVSSIGASISLILGCMALFLPQKIGVFVSLKAIGTDGVSEIKATYGGFFIGISVYALFSQESAVFLTVGIGWLAASFVRLITISTGSYTHKNLGGVIFEAVVGMLCMWGVIT